MQLESVIAVGTMQLLIQELSALVQDVSASLSVERLPQVCIRCRKINCLEGLSAAWPMQSSCQPAGSVV